MDFFGCFQITVVQLYDPSNMHMQGIGVNAVQLYEPSNTHMQSLGAKEL